MNRQTVSIVIATYNAKEYLKLVLKSIAAQTVLPVEVLIADDGSSDGTGEMINAMSQNFPCPLIHVWQEDDGFKKSAIINKALAKAKGEYIVHIDGDVLLNRHFIEDHLYVARKGYITTGSRAQTTEKLKNKMFETEKVDITPFTSGVKRRQNAFRCKLLMKSFLYSYKKNIPYFSRGCNLAFWKEDFLKVNGFNEDIPHIGTEDYEFTARLNNIGIKRQFIKFGATQFHIYHTKRAVKTSAENQKILDEVIEHKLTRCVNGVDRYLSIE